MCLMQEEDTEACVAPGIVFTSKQHYKELKRVLTRCKPKEKQTHQARRALAPRWSAEKTLEMGDPF